MSIYLNKDSKIIVQGMTGGMGAKHTTLMVESGADIVGGVNARKAGTTVSHTAQDGSTVELPVFGTVAEASEAIRLRPALTSASAKVRSSAALW